MNEKNQKAYQKMKKAKNILLVTHAKPDGDAVSSICTMMLVLDELDKNYTAFCLDQAPEQLMFLPLAEKIESDKSKINFADYDLIVAVDCGSLSRTNLVKELSSRRDDQLAIEFDHHPKIDDYADIEIRTPEAASTTEVLYYFLKDNYIKINKKLANCILTGILTDTGNFLYPSTTDKTVQIASEMMLYGAKFPLITEETWRNKSIAAMKLWGKAMGNLTVNEKYNIAFTVLSKEDIEECACLEEEMEGISGFLSNLYGVNGLVFIRETKDGKIKGSLRTTVDNIDISKLAHRLGGGGHKKASGFHLDMGIERTETGWQVK